MSNVKESRVKVKTHSFRVRCGSYYYLVRVIVEAPHPIDSEILERVTT